MAALMTRRIKGLARRALRRTVDIVLATLLVVQMCYQLLPEDFHAFLGVVMVAAAGVRIWLNGTWIRSLRTGRWGAARLLFAVCAGASLLLIALLALSGLVLSGILPALRPLDGLARAAHLSSSYLALLVLPLHAGLHVAKTLSRSTSNVAKPAEKLGLTAWLLASCAGVYEFFSLHIWDYVTLRMPFVLPAGAPLPVYLLEHMCVMALFALLGSPLMRAASARGRRRARR
ncbi:MAG: hypothetical protein U0N89_00820 [Collinsella intestinalis]